MRPFLFCVGCHGAPPVAEGLPHTLAPPGEGGRRPGEGLFALPRSALQRTNPDGAAPVSLPRGGSAVPPLLRAPFSLTWPREIVYPLKCSFQARRARIGPFFCRFQPLKRQRKASPP